jgi:uncharacterized cupin superfamily protein/catechol 2,3-dioxygenase-like lactoylglutathione lyase family enzyme
VAVEHLALPVTDQERSRRFYETYFGFDAAPARHYDGGVLMLYNAEGFSLALGPAEGPILLPPFLHFGVHAQSPEDVHRFRSRLAADGVAIVEEWSEPAYVSVKCSDPDGYVVEYAWEPRYSQSMVREAPIEKTENGAFPTGDGWFVVNARDARWFESDGLGFYCGFESKEARFPELGINLNILRPGEPMCMYHGEEAQEDFLVLSGECLLIVDGQERPLRAWDFVHCPAWTEHVFVGAGGGPCLVLAVGARTSGKGIRYPVNETALRHGAGVSEETDEPQRAYERFTMPEPAPCPGEFPG